MQRRTFIKRGLATAAFLSCGAAAYGGIYERHEVEVVAVPLHLGLATPLRMALIADIHFDPLYEIGYLDTVFRTVATTNPDLVLYAGDYVTHRTDRVEEFAQIAGRLRPPLGSYAALGNHDHMHGPTQIQQVLEANGIRVLRNAMVPIPGQPGWGISGLESFLCGHPDTSFLTLQPADAQLINIVHEPDAWDFLRDPRIRLQVSGHTHGGQVRSPLIGAFDLPSMGKRYDAGLFRRDEQFLYVNRGIGTIAVPCRVNCRPEITLFELT